jgi:FkbM family methyltransferase
MIKIKRELIKAFWKIVPRSIRIKVRQTSLQIPLQRGLDHRVLKTDGEQWMNILIETIARHEKGAFIDVGANAGQTLLKVKSLLPHMQYIGFEPNIYCAGYVSQIIQANRFKDCVIFPIGLGDKDSIATLFCHNHSDPKGTVIDNFRGREATLLQQTVLIRDAGAFLNSLNIDKIALVKIDVEGYEASVLSGMKSILQQQRPFIICEVLRTHGPHHPSYDFRCTSRSICETVLSDSHYAIWVATRRLTIEPVAHLSDLFTNYIFVPQEKVFIVQQMTT